MPYWLIWPYNFQINDCISGDGRGGLFPAERAGSAEIDGAGGDVTFGDDRSITGWSVREGPFHRNCSFLFYWFSFVTAKVWILHPSAHIHDLHFIIAYRHFFVNYFCIFFLYEIKYSLK
jgi:hypothetical protein